MTALTSSAAFKHVGGFPFLDPTFDPARLLTAVVCCRWTRVNPAPAATPGQAELSTMLEPDRARQIRGLDLELDLPFGKLCDTQLDEVRQTRDAIVAWIPGWAPLVRLPLKFLALEHSDAVSSSNFAWPQHIFLAPAAFARATTLAEQVTHETCHQWLYLVEELWPLQVDTPGVRVTLPSGTPGRSPSELLGASHVAVNLHRLWTTMPADEDDRRRRLDHLHRYARGCVDLLADTRDVLTDDGQALADRLTQELTTL